MMGEGAERPRSSLPYFGGIALLAAIYFAAAKLGLSLAFTTAQVTTVWPPTGIALAALLLFGSRMWPGVFLGAFVANVLTDEPVFVALGISLGNTLEAFVGSFLLRRVVGFRPALDRPEDVLGLVVLAAMLSTIVSATVGVLSLSLGGIVEAEHYISVWLIWWVGDLMGAIVVAPLLLVWASGRRLANPLLKKPVEATLLLGGLFAVGIFVFTGSAHTMPEFLSLVYLIFPFMVWAAFRFGQVGVVTSVFLVSSIAVLGTLHRVGPFAASPFIERNLVFLHTFMFTVSVGSMLIAAAITAARRSEERFRRIYESSKDAIGFSTLDGVLVDVNDAFLALTGYSREELVSGKRYQDITPPEYHTDEAHIIARIVKTGKAEEYEKEYVRKDGRRVPLLLTAFLVKGFSGEPIGLAAVIKDITERRQIEHTKDEIISLASHQLRTPLTVIKWCAKQLLGAARKLSRDNRQCLEDIYQANQRMVYLVDALLDVSRLELGTAEIETVKVDVRELARAALRELRTDVREKKLRVTERYAADVPQISGSRRFIMVALQNVLSNAVKYTPKGGKVTIAVSRYAGALPHAPLPEGVLFEVRDTGCGIPRDEQPKIFTKLFRASNARKVDPEGTGLGLYLAKTIAERSGGAIWFESEEAKGSAFFIALPRKNAWDKRAGRNIHRA